MTKTKIRGGPAGILWVALILLCGGCATKDVEPPNLSRLKGEIVEYVDSGRYFAQVRKASQAATVWIEQRAKAVTSPSVSPGSRRLAVVFDIDETLLSNLPHMREQDFGYQPAAWDAWVARGAAPVIEPVREIYQRCRELGLDVILITGRREHDRAGTEKNLREVGVADYAMIFFKPDASKDNSEKFKTAKREWLTAEGWTIIANIGDQESDLAGGFAERTFKLPAPFYLSK